MLRLPKPHLKLPIRRTGAHERDEQEFSRGQIIVLFALSLIVLVGIMGLAIDVTFAWVNELRIQKAADAGALAGAVYLPDDPGTGQTASLAETVQNGYTNQTGGVVVDAHQDATNKEQMDVTITAPIPTFFMRIFGITSLSSSRTAHAQFHLPVPMGSPLNVFGFPTQKDLQGNPLNYWAAIQGPCTLKANGDPYATKDTTSVDSNCSTATVDNTEYKVPTTGDPGAYNYAIKVPVAGNLVVQLYDPEFCARASQNSDTGDIAFTSANFNTVFTLYNPSDTPYDLTDDTAIVSTSYPGNGTTGNATDTADSCSSYYVTKPSDYKGKWITFTTFAAAPGTYRLNVGTTTVGTKAADGTNEFGLQATLNGGAGLQPQVYAGLAGTDSAMSIYNNLTNGTSYIYLAQINATMQGKTMEVDLFDPGDITKLHRHRVQMAKLWHHAGPVRLDHVGTRGWWSPDRI
jgi:hypothetical protein